MAEVLHWRTMGIREVLRTKRRQVGLKDPTAVEVLRRVKVEEVRREGIEEVRNAHEQRQMKKIKAWCQRRARRRRRQAAGQQAALNSRHGCERK